jgi:leucyl/phenylalanyl-tRNA--protein transferase
MRQFLKKGTVRITLDTAFDAVISACGKPRPTQNGTWITAEMKAAYNNLHRLGFAHSVEAWDAEGKLVGGLYGVSLGSAFFGESMFTVAPNASKAAFITLVALLEKRGFDLIDCQTETRHLGSLGARPVPRAEFCHLLDNALNRETIYGNWGKFLTTGAVEA